MPRPKIKSFMVLIVSKVETYDEWFLPYIDGEEWDRTSLQWMHLRPPRKIEVGEELVCAFDEKGIMVAVAVVLRWASDKPSQIRMLPGYPETVCLTDVIANGFTKA